MNGNPCRAERPLHRCAQGLGGFYEAIMALMIVTAGVALMTASLTFLVPAERDDELDRQCQRMLSEVLEDPALAPSDRTLDQRALGRNDWASVLGGWGGGARVFLTYPDGSSEVLFRTDYTEVGDRRSATEPVNVVDGQGDSEAALLTVWVWR